MYKSQISLSLIFFCLIALLRFEVYGQRYDTLYQNRIKEFTTDTRFFAESIGTIIDHPTIPSPLDHFGTIIGAPGVMHRTTEIYGYYKVLAETSPNLIVKQTATSEEGRPTTIIIFPDTF